MRRTFEVITSCSADGWKKYGENCIKTFLQHWPEEVKLTVYTEGFSVEEYSRVQSFPLMSIKWLGDFKERHKNNAKANGLGGVRYDFAFDAVRFSHKVAAYTHAFMRPGCREIGIWMDADCITHSPVTIPWLDDLIPEDACIAWLNRATQYPECGFIMFNTSDESLQQMLNDLVYCYASGQIFQLQEWHDSYVFQQLVHQYMRDRNIRVSSLSRTADVLGHPLINGPLGACLDHLKGIERKEIGRSHKRDLRVKRTERYWLPT